jgi:hypothetical protein
MKRERERDRNNQYWFVMLRSDRSFFRVMHPKVIFRDLNLINQLFIGYKCYACGGSEMERYVSNVKVMMWVRIL